MASKKVQETSKLENGMEVARRSMVQEREKLS